MLFETYTALIRKFPSGCASLYGEELQRKSGVWLAVDERSFPSLLFSCLPSDTRNDIALRFIGVQFARECEIGVDGGGHANGTFSIVRLEENDPDLVRVFLRLLEETFCGDALTPLTNREISERILELANLFSQLEHSAKDLLGLWGELLIISRAAAPAAAAERWCLDRNAKYDFVCDDFALEVKTTLKPSRVHRFALDQLRPHGELPVYVASVQAIQAHGGTTVSELMDRILEVITDAELRRSFLALCLLKGGEDIYKSGLRLQLLSVETGVAYFAAGNIPVPIVDTASPISNVKFDVCLDQLQCVDRQNCNSLAQLTRRAVNE
ncbi:MULTISPECIES: PD-(D/E)XK motif protein [Sphingomonadales]|uniref:Uncharacterized protein n=2 Tax=Sphingomonadales TaxID=204457 RepID=A0A0G3XHV6_9SPHN|nr:MULTISPECIES: PD-(D/E)XK motif protein [Sphingomonadales]AKM11105.1 hypothetical protein AB433_15800 [Croceicoccus naphthovorans]MBB3989449.1 hypothetical protein [Croceicoccus naphthovorans]PCF92366.1 PD-(D/E)XK motif protein [Sphingopyxis terrae subsp. ummariensis]SMQ63605.1 Putative PD-(D/E)XK family member [Sphingopyxis terrae subsp. ummariensis]